MMDKADQRRAAKARRQNLADPAFGEKLARHADALALAPGAIVAGYAAFRDEADPSALMGALAARGHALALPALAGKDAPLRFHAWCESDVLVPHPYGMNEPHPDCAIVVPDVLLVPLLAFDSEGYRLGYGGGFYDRTLQALRAARSIIAIGIAYAGQEIETVRHDAQDQRLDAVLTEKGLRRL